MSDADDVTQKNNFHESPNSEPSPDTGSTPNSTGSETLVPNPNTPHIASLALGLREMNRRDRIEALAKTQLFKVQTRHQADRQKAKAECGNFIRSCKHPHRQHRKTEGSTGGKGKQKDVSDEEGNGPEPSTVAEASLGLLTLHS